MFDDLKINGTVVLYHSVFKKLHQELLNHFKDLYKIEPQNLIDYQLYGFNNFSDTVPSIRKMLAEETKIVLNGKYLYNKYRELKDGVQYIKLSREYSFVYFHCLGYKDINDFTDRSLLLSEEDKKYQRAITENGKEPIDDTEFYVGYYVGEDKSVIKTKFSFSPASKLVELILYYWIEDDLRAYKYLGTITEHKNILTVVFKKENSDVGRAAFINIYLGNEHIVRKPMLKGLYLGSDMSDRPVCGEIVFQCVKNKEDQHALATSPDPVPSTIVSYLKDRRLVTHHE